MTTHDDLPEDVPFDVAGDYILVELVEQGEQITASGLHIAAERKRPSRATVVAAGPDAHVLIVAGDGAPYGRALRRGDELEVRKHALQSLELTCQDDRELYMIQPPGVIGVFR